MCTEAPLCSVDATWLVVLMMSTEKSKKKQEQRVHNDNQCTTVQILTSVRTTIVKDD